MNLPILIAAFITLCFGGIAIWCSVRLDKLTRIAQTEKATVKEKDDVTHMVVHELRAPLTAIKESAKLLETSQSTMQQVDKDHLLSLIHDQSDRLLMQISTILDAGKMQEGKFQIHKDPGDLNKLAADALVIFKPQAAMKQITLTFTPSPNLPSASFDHGYMTEVLNNLVSNSLKYTRAGGSINLSTASTETNVTLIVSDTGIGIPKDKQAKLFTKFTQAHDGDGSIGSGLGLYIVKGIIEAHQGSIAFDSIEDKGTTITVSLPRNTATPAIN